MARSCFTQAPAAPGSPLLPSKSQTSCFSVTDMYLQTIRTFRRTTLQCSHLKNLTFDYPVTTRLQLSYNFLTVCLHPDPNKVPMLQLPALPLALHPPRLAAISKRDQAACILSVCVWHARVGRGRPQAGAVTPRLSARGFPSNPAGRRSRHAGWPRPHRSHRPGWALRPRPAPPSAQASERPSGTSGEERVAGPRAEDPAGPSAGEPRGLVVRRGDSPGKGHEGCTRWGRGWGWHWRQKKERARAVAAWRALGGGGVHGRKRVQKLLGKGFEPT